MNNNRILFMIINNQVTYLQNSTMDHREWYNTLGLDPNQFELVIRGFIMDGKIVFYKGINFNYDEEVINAAKRYAPSMRVTLNNLNLDVCCGVLINPHDSKWEPIVKLNDTELTGIVDEPKVEKKPVVEKPHEAMIDFKNNYSDPLFRKRAIIVTIITLVLAILVKISLIFSQKMYLSNFGDFILMIAQVGLLGGCIYSYKNQREYTRYLGIGAGIAMLLMFDLLDIIIGILYLIFSIDEGYYIKLINFVKGLLKKKQQ